MTRGFVAGALTALACLTAARYAAGAVTPAQKCRAAKLNAITKQATAELSCYSKALNAGTVVDPACLADAGAKLLDAFTKAEAKGGCQIIGNAIGVATRVNALGVTLAAELPPGPPICQCGSGVPTGLTFTTAIPSGDCGSVGNGSGEPAPLACGGLYVGGGNTSVPLPITIPDQALLSTQVTACDHTSLAVSAPSGGFFGPPTPVPNPIAVPTSVCIVNKLADIAVGVADCVLGSALIDMPVGADVFLTGDGLPNRCSDGPNPGGPCNIAADCGGFSCVSDPDIQPCPLCNPTTLKCNGGPNNGSACTPGDSASLGAAFPTSLDCPPDGGQKIATLSLRFDLDTGMPSVAAAPSGTESLVFCGFCRDVTSTGSLCFEGSPPVGCPASAMTGVAHRCVSDADCAAPFESCEQMSDGAFGQPTTGSITENGSAAGDLTDAAPHAATLGSIFCVPPVFNAPVDAVADLPGPGGVALQGMMQLVP